MQQGSVKCAPTKVRLRLSVLAPHSSSSETISPLSHQAAYINGVNPPTVATSTRGLRLSGLMLRASTQLILYARLTDQMLVRLKDDVASSQVSLCLITSLTSEVCLLAAMKWRHVRWLTRSRSQKSAPASSSKLRPGK